MRLPSESALLLRVAAALVPADRRDEWRREWNAELWWWLASAPDPSRRELASHCWGAVLDAYSLRAGANLCTADFLARPSSRLAVPVLLLTFLAVFSGGFRYTRRALFGIAPDRLAIVTETGPFMGQVMPLPSARLARWAARSRTLDGLAPLNRTQALVRLQPGIAPVQAERELQASNQFLQVTPCTAVIARPIAVLGFPFLGFVLLALVEWLWFPPSAFSLAHPLGWVTVLFLAAAEAPASPMAIVLPYLVASFMALRYCRRDRRERCPLCLERLGQPVRIGVGPRGPFEPAGTEWLCPQGHGALFTTRETEPESHWISLVA